MVFSMVNNNVMCHKQLMVPYLVVLRDIFICAMKPECSTEIHVNIGGIFFFLMVLIKLDN